jgi:hypothetical protein
VRPVKGERWYVLFPDPEGLKELYEIEVLEVTAETVLCRWEHWNGNTFEGRFRIGDVIWAELVIEKEPRLKRVK